MESETEVEGINQVSRQPEKIQAERLAEFSALRSEVLKRIEWRFKTLELAITAAGIFIAAVATEFIYPFVLLFYPLLGLGMAIAWTQNDIRVGQMAEYIMQKYEKHHSGIYWEHWLRETYKKELPYGIYQHFTEYTALFVFAGTQFIATALAILFQHIDGMLERQEFLEIDFWPIFWVMIPLNILAIWATYQLVWLRRKAYREKRATSQTPAEASTAQDA